MPLTLANQRIVVMGVGTFGGGLGAAEYLAKQHPAHLLVTDQKSQRQLGNVGEKLAAMPVQRRLGEHRIDDFEQADLIVVNPAVPPFDNPYLDAAVEHGAQLTTELGLLIDRLQCHQGIVAVTGSAGKSTTCAMIAHILQHARLPRHHRTPASSKVAAASSRWPDMDDAAATPARTVWLGGNIGGSLLHAVDRIQPHQPVVLEVSSAQLHYLQAANLGFAPHVAVLTNLEPNHLDWHRSFEHYRQSKQHLLDHQQLPHVAVMGPATHQHFQPRTSRVHWFDAISNDNAAAAPFDLLTPGQHNQINAGLALRAALALASTLNLAIDAIAARDALASFPGLPHRLQLVAQINGVQCYNDSKSTTDKAARFALNAFDPSAVHWIAGGYDKGIDLTPLAQFAARRCAAIYTIGSTGPAIAAAARRTPDHCPVHEAEQLEPAVRQAVDHATPGQVVLLSPACASWDQFENFQQRGTAFAQAVLRMGSD